MQRIIKQLSALLLLACILSISFVACSKPEKELYRDGIFHFTELAEAKWYKSCWVYPNSMYTSGSLLRIELNKEGQRIIFDRIGDIKVTKYSENDKLDIDTAVKNGNINFLFDPSEAIDESDESKALEVYFSMPINLINIMPNGTICIKGDGFIYISEEGAVAFEELKSFIKNNISDLIRK